MTPDLAPALFVLVVVATALPPAAAAGRALRRLRDARRVRMDCARRVWRARLEAGFGPEAAADFVRRLAERDNAAP